MADSYTIGRQRAGGGTAALLPLGGELDINARGELCHAILGVLDTGATEVVLDLAEVTFLDSEALGALIEGYNAARARSVGFRVVNARGPVDRVLTVSGAADLFGS